MYGKPFHWIGVKVKQSDELTRFYNEMQKWIDRGTPSHPYFSNKQALCWNLRKFREHHGIDIDKYLVVQLGEQFIEAGLSMTFPFNDGSQLKFYHENEDIQHYSNKARLEWVRTHQQEI